MKIEEVVNRDEFSPNSRLSILRLPPLSSPSNLTGPDPQTDAVENSDKVNSDPGTKKREDENIPPKTNERIKSKPKKGTRQCNWKVRAPKYLPKTAERLSVIQRTYGVTVVPERVLFRSLRPQVQSNARKIMHFLEKKKSDKTKLRTASQDVHTIEVAVPLVADKKHAEDTTLNDESLSSFNESSVSLPSSSDESRTPMPSLLPTLKKKRYTKTRKTEKKEIEEEKVSMEEKDEVIQKKEGEKDKRMRERPNFQKKRKTQRASKDITQFFLNLTKKPSLKSVDDPRLKDQQRLLLDYYIKCRDFLMAAPKADAVNKYCSNVNNSAGGPKEDNGKQSMTNLNKAFSIANVTVNVEENENDDSSEKISEVPGDILRKQSLNSLEDFDVFVAKTVMEKIRKNKKRRARVKSLLKKEYAKKYNDVLDPSSNDEADANHFNAALADGHQPNNSAKYEGERNNILSSGSSDEFSDLRDSPEPMISSIDRFDNFVAKLIKKHMHRQAMLRKKTKQKCASTKLFNSYEAWLQRRIFGYGSRKKPSQNSNVSNFMQQNKRKSSKRIKKSCRTVTLTSDSLFSDDVAVVRPPKDFVKKVLIEDVMKAMQCIDNELTTGKLRNDVREESDNGISRTSYSSGPSSLKLPVNRSDSLPLLSEFQEKRAEAINRRIESMLSAPIIHRNYQIANAIPFSMPRKVFHFSDVDKCKKFQDMVQKCTGRDHVLLNSVRAMNEINTRLLSYHKESTDRHKQMLRKLERKRREALIREGLMERDFDDLEVKRQRQFLRQYYNPKRVIRNFTANPMRNRYDMASKSFKVLDHLNVAESFAKMQTKKQRKKEPKTLFKHSHYKPMLQSENSDQKQIISIRGKNMDEYYSLAKTAVHSAFSPSKILTYKADKTIDCPDLMADFSSDSSDNNHPSSSKSSKGIFGRFTREETKKREKREQKEREKAKRKLQEAKKAAEEEKLTQSEITNVTSLSTLTGKEITHLRIPAGEPPPTLLMTGPADKDVDDSETITSITIGRKLSDQSEDTSQPEKTVEGLVKIIDAMIVGMDEDHNFELMSGKKKRLSRKSSRTPSFLKTHEDVDVLQPLLETRTMTPPVLGAKPKRVRSMRPGMKLSSSQPTLPGHSPSYSQPIGESRTPSLLSAKDGRISDSQERRLSSLAMLKEIDDLECSKVPESKSRFMEQSSVSLKSPAGAGQGLSNRVPSSEQLSMNTTPQSKEFTDSRIFFGKPPKKSKRKSMRYH